ncbi:hypothetical protein FSZ31_02420 [Sphingorhabdus soli]|uniref:Uncharacterized protein n=1 Tax=Flavisphingopyxis soli TaxID=2601267 RepID=A0A5C6UKY0_9SPHN|nr:hypothetical protein [Sphingorhabdus soli]TXC73617.1 hypothetical protein FSZ31_02420 [Sphingorhabdus soli]
MFEGKASSRADLKSGTLYAVAGEAQWIYYGQVTTDKRVGFFRRRDRDVASTTDILSTPPMAVIGVGYSSITRAMRSGSWSKLGRFELIRSLKEPWPMVQWPVGTLIVSVSDSDAQYDTRIEDPAIQNMEIAAIWDAEQDIPARLTADFGKEEAAWQIGGPVWRERRVREEYARRFPEAPWHQLPPDWVQTTFS